MKITERTAEWIEISMSRVEAWDIIERLLRHLHPGNPEPVDREIRFTVYLSGSER